MKSFFRSIKKYFFLFLKINAIIFASLIGLVALTFIYFARDLPRPEKFTEKETPQASKIYDRTGKVLLYTIYGEEKRTIVPLSQISPYLQKAVIEAEDANFYQHRGVELKAILRSLWLNIQKGEPLYGGSTISQQLIRSAFLSQDKTFKRKIREIILAILLERKYSKDQILEWYLNQIPFGYNNYGVEAASQFYFGKSAKDLSLNESAFLAALIQAPSYFSPYGEHKAELLKRKDFILEKLERKKIFESSLIEEAKNIEPKILELKTPIKAPHFTLYVKELLEKEFGADFLREKGLKIYTTLDWDLQQTAELLVAQQSKINEKYRALNLALTAIDPKNGQVLALVGSKDWFGEPYPKNCLPGKNCLFDPKTNIATSLPGRQPGSAFKPFVYATAFEKGFSDLTVVVDEPTNFGIWGGKPYQPKNYDGRFRGPVTLRQALAQSLNVPSVKVLAYLAGLEDSIKKAKEMGVTTLNKPPSYYGLSLVLGGGEVKLLDMTLAYGVFANEGKKLMPVFILKIEDSQGNILKENNFVATRRILSTKTCRLISDILSDNQARAPIFGQNSALNITEFQAPVKTGTTNDFKDGWTIGYTSELVVGVWAGNNDGTPILKEPGLTVAAPLWRNFILEAAKKYPPKPFLKP
jgi:1A family penicillin-binding protein